MNTSIPKKIMILAGGTGGHVMPALAVARCLQKQGINVHWLGTRSGIEATLVEASGIPLSYIDIQGIRGKRWQNWLLAPYRILKALWQSLHVLRQVHPNVILSMGGYVAGPAAIAGLLLRKPLVLHEQNAIAGTTNRLLANKAKKIMVAFPNVLANFSQKVILTGNPIRQDLLTISSPDTRFSQAKAPLKVLVLGGSAGAMVLNETLPHAFALFDEAIRPHIIHQCGKDKLSATEQAYNNCGVHAQVCAFIDDMVKAYAFADVVICRAGALTVAELAVVGVPSILIPFPYAIDDHQTVNAKYLSENNAAILLPQGELTAQKLYELLMDLYNNPQKRLHMAMACRQLAKPNATQEVAQYCIGAMSG